MNMVKKLGITEQDAPKFYAWLKRHIEVDSDDHGPAALTLVEVFCDTDEKLKEAQAAAHKSIDDKIAFWDAVRKIIRG
jgi:pyrroloquinoline quinone (PQQ) biosynthesis protein C